MAVTTSNGNGFALYNGVKLPSLPLYDDSLFQYGYIIDFTSIYGEVAVGLLVSDTPASWFRMNNATLFGWNGDGSTVVEYMYIPSDVDYSNGFSFFEEKVLEPGVSVIMASADSPLGDPIWCNIDVVLPNGYVYLAASDPIPLDGMNVIEWDGDTTGLEIDGSNYRVYDSISTSSMISVYKSTDSSLIVGTYFEDFADFGIWVAGLNSEELPWAFGDDNGTWFLKEAGTPNNSYCCLIAYPASGGDEGDDEGDESTALKHYCRVNGSVHEVEGGTARISGSYHEIEVGTVRIEGAYYEIGFDGSIGGDSGGDEGGGSLDGVIFQAGEGLLQGTVTATPNNPSFTTLISYSVTDSYITTKGGNAQQTVGGNTVYIPAFYTLTIGPFDATDCDTLHVELTSNIGVIKCESGTDSVASGVITNSATAEEVTLDISGLSGECNVVIGPGSNITSSTIFNATIYKIWLT